MDLSPMRTRQGRHDDEEALARDNVHTIIGDSKAYTFGCVGYGYLGFPVTFSTS